jgi:hypothetical protein
MVGECLDNQRVRPLKALLLTGNQPIAVINIP